MTILDQYGKNLKNKLSKLSFAKKVEFGHKLLKGQTKFVESFDNLYTEKLTHEFTSITDIAIQQFENGNTQKLESLIKKAYALTPDTEEYGETEGTLAQNSFLSLVYILKFLQNNDNNDLWQSIEKKLESIDAVNLDSPTPTEDSILFADEINELLDLASQEGG